MSIATSSRCLNELAQIQDGGKLASSLLCSKLKSRGALINDMYDDDYDDTELESFDQELHRRYNLMYFVPRSKFNKRDVEVDAYENDDDENEGDYEDYENDENVKFKKRSIVEPLKRKPEKQSLVSSSTPTPSPSPSPSPPPIRQSDTSTTPSISTTNSIEKQSSSPSPSPSSSPPSSSPPPSSPPSSSPPSSSPPSSSPSSSPTTNIENVKVNKTVPVKDALYWWRNDPLINVHHEHWHVVFVNSPVNGTYKDREGENFIYMHRFMLARYDAERYALGVAKVAPLPNYRDPIPDAFYPPSHLYEVVDDKVVHFPSRPPGQVFHDTVVMTEDNRKDDKSYTLKELENALITLEKWIDGEETYLSPSDLLNDPAGNTDLGAVIEDILHNVGHAMLGRVMAPNDTSAPPGVLVGARAGCRDPLFWRWHRHIDDIYVRWQTRLGLNMFSNDIPPIKIRNNDIFLAFKDELFNLDNDGDHNGWVKYAKKTIGGSNFDKTLVNVTGFTNELQTTMKQRVHVWLEDTNDKEIIEFMYPREFFTFFRIENLSSKSLPVTFRVFIVPEVFMDSYVHWIELDKFKRILKPYEKTIISQDCDQSIGIRKPAQKTIKQMERSTQMTPSYVNSLEQLTLDKQSEALFCGCGWPYHMVIPRGTKEGLRFKMMVYVSDGKDDMVPVAPTCGSQLLCGSRKWRGKYPDKHPMGYPFDRPFINNSFYQTFAHLPNVAIRDFVIRWVEDFPLLVPLHN